MEPPSVGKIPVLPRVAWAAIGVTTIVLLGAGSAVAVSTARADQPSAVSMADSLTDPGPRATSSGPRIPLLPQGDPNAVVPPTDPLASAAVPATDATVRAAAVPATEAVAASQVPSQERILALVTQNFPASEVGNAMAVAQCESRQSNLIGSTNQDGTTDFGVFQLNDGGSLQTALGLIRYPYKTSTDAQNAALREDVNVRAAAALWRSRGGWGPWVCAYKIGVVTSLYDNQRGPAYGTFSAVGNPGLTLSTAKPVKEPVKKPVKKPSKKPSRNPANPADPIREPVDKPLPGPQSTNAPAPVVTASPTPPATSSVPTP